jgi:hypothetical protein
MNQQTRLETPEGTPSDTPQVTFPDASELSETIAGHVSDLLERVTRLETKLEELPIPQKKSGYFSSWPFGTRKSPDEQSSTPLFSDTRKTSGTNYRNPYSETGIPEPDFKNDPRFIVPRRKPATRYGFWGFGGRRRRNRTRNAKKVGRSRRVH